MPRGVAVVIPTRDRVDLLAQCLSSPGLAPAPEGVEVIVVDNGSTDGTTALLARTSAVRTLRHAAGATFSHACNAAARAARGEVLVFLNNDTIPAVGWLEPLVSWLEPPDVGAVGSVLRYPDGAIQHAGVGFAADGGPANVRLPARRFAADHVVVQAVTGAALAIRRDTFVSHGGFDEGFHNSYEDVDLCVRLRRAGLRNVLATTPDIVHLESQTDGRHDHDEANARRFASRWARSCVPDLRRIRARLDGAAAGVEVLDVGADPAGQDARLRDGLAASPADRWLLWAGGRPAPATDATSDGEVISFRNRLGGWEGLACRRPQLERVGLPPRATLASVRERLLTVYGERRPAR
jgi:GT2 family glycosyltransferase